MTAVLPVILFVLAATLSPGGATTLATASGARFGLRRSLPLIAGIAGGLALLAATTALGLGRLLATWPSLQTVVRVLGSAYLLWLAWRIMRSGAPDARDGPARPVTLAGGVLLLWLNPKSWAMTLGAASSFALLADGPGRLALWLGVAFGAAAGASLTLWCALGVLLARLLRKPSHWRILNVAMGLLLVASLVPAWRSA